MRITNLDKLKMAEDHILRGKSLSYIYEEYGIIQSMRRKGNCLDNSPTENLFGRMKEGMWYGHQGEYRNADELIKAIHEYVIYYNNE